MNITKKHIRNKSRNSKIKEKYHINEKTHLTAGIFFYFIIPWKLLNEGSFNKLREEGGRMGRGRKKIEKLISVPLRLLGTQEYVFQIPNQDLQFKTIMKYCVKFNLTNFFRYVHIACLAFSTCWKNGDAVKSSCISGVVHKARSFVKTGTYKSL